MNTLNMRSLVVSVIPGGVTQILEVWQMRVQMHGPKTDQRSEERLIQDEKILDFASLASACRTHASREFRSSAPVDQLELLVRPFTGHSDPRELVNPIRKHRTDGHGLPIS